MSPGRTRWPNTTRRQASPVPSAATDAPIESASHCHCSQCRKAHGAAFATYGKVRREA
ncbi:GFA family protein, partial [Klebsiella pneumoniae subsp. pneumoniae]